MPIWFGSALGSAIGLIAILLGALYNAKLTRNRDNKIMDSEAKAIAAAIGAEMSVYVEMLYSLFMQAQVPNRSKAATKALRAPDLVVWPSLANKIGLLGADLADKTVRSHMLLSMHARMLQACIDDTLDGARDENTINSRVAYLMADIPKIADTVEALTGTRPEFI